MLSVFAWLRDIFPGILLCFTCSMFHATGISARSRPQGIVSLGDRIWRIPPQDEIFGRSRKIVLLRLHIQVSMFRIKPVVINYLF